MQGGTWREDVVYGVTRPPQGRAQSQQDRRPLNLFLLCTNVVGTGSAARYVLSAVRLFKAVRRQVIDVQQETDKSAPKLLATLADHFSAVNVARFSRSGRFLASGTACAGPLTLPELPTNARRYCTSRPLPMRDTALHSHGLPVRL